MIGRVPIYIPNSKELEVMKTKGELKKLEKDIKRKLNLMEKVYTNQFFEKVEHFISVSPEERELYKEIAQKEDGKRILLNNIKLVIYKYSSDYFINKLFLVEKPDHYFPEFLAYSLENFSPLKPYVSCLEKLGILKFDHGLNLESFINRYYNPKLPEEILEDITKMENYQANNQYNGKTKN